MTRKYDRKAKGYASADNTKHKGWYEMIGDKTQPKCGCGWEGKYHNFPFSAILELDCHYDKCRTESV